MYPGGRATRCAATRRSGARWTLLVEVGGGSTSLTLLRRGEPTRSGVYALGAVRLRQQLDLRRHSHECRWRCSGATSRTSSRKSASRCRSTASRTWSRSAATCGSPRRRFWNSEDDDGVREIPPRARSSRSATRSSGWTRTASSNRFRLPAVEAETLVPALLVYRALLAETGRAQVVVVSMPRCGPACCSTSPTRAAGSSAEDFERQVLASAEALGQRYRFDRDARPSRRDAGDAAVRRAARRARPGGSRTAAAAGRRPAARRRHLRQPARASQAFAVPARGLADLRAVRRGNRDRRPTSPAITGGGLPQKSHLPYIALDRSDRV